MIYFRKVKHPRNTSATFWYVEYYDDEMPAQMFPVGTAYAVTLRKTAQLNFVLVADQWRRKGIAEALLNACRKRWPDLQYTSGMDRAGKALLRKCAPHLAEGEM